MKKSELENLKFEVEGRNNTRNVLSILHTMFFIKNKYPKFHLRYCIMKKLFSFIHHCLSMVKIGEPHVGKSHVGNENCKYIAFPSLKILFFLYYEKKKKMRHPLIRKIYNRTKLNFPFK